MQLSARQLWFIVLGLVTLLALISGGLMVWLQPHLSMQTPPGSLLSTAAIAPMAALFVLACMLAVASPKIPALALPAWLLVLGGTGLAAGLALVIPWETSQVLASGHWGMSNLYEVSVLTLAITGTLTLGYDLTLQPASKAKTPQVGRLLPLVTPILAAAAAFSYWLTTIGAATPSELVPALQNSILPFHVATNFIGYGCFAIAAGAAVGMLLRLRADAKQQPSRLPSVAVLEKLAYRAIVLGFPIFSVAILLGCVWAYQAWGGYWSWDPKETWALIVWLIYATYLHSRLTHRPRPAVLAWWLLLGFAATLFCYIGVNMFLSGLHSYGSLAA